MDELTACGKCAYFVREGRIWYDHYCSALPINTKFDYVSGVVVDTKLEYARDINKGGHCEHYLSK